MPLYGSIRFISVTLLLYLVSALTARAQNTPLRGRVSDETGAVIPGATITATDPTGDLFDNVLLGRLLLADRHTARNLRC